MQANNSNANKAQAIALQTNQLNKNQRHKTMALASAWLLAAGLLYSMTLKAETNAAGIEIEYINEPAITTDAVQEILVDIDAGNTNNSVIEAESDLWARIKAGYEMPDVNSPLTATHEEWYASRPDYVKRMVERGQRYMFHIVEEVQKRNMPTEIALLPMIESAFNPQAFSRSKAAGIWQFMPATGKHFGLQQNWWADNRRDVTAATNAALDYLQKLHGMFGSWDLALAAYNAGEGTVQRAIDKNRRLGLPTDYISLNLPLETVNYVPKLQAVKNIMTEPAKFGLNIATMPNRPYFARVTTPKQIDAKLAAQLAEISIDEFSALNPSYNRPVITSQGEKHQLLLPVWAAERFASNLASYDKPLTNWQTYQAKHGERVDNIAKKFGTHASQLRAANGLSNNDKIHGAQTMLVPTALHASTNHPNNSANSISALDINAMNVDANENDNLNSNALDEPKDASRVIFKAKFHRVKKGETLTALAVKYNLSTSALMELNDLKNSKVKIGQHLTIAGAMVKSKDKLNQVKQSHAKNSHFKSANFKHVSLKSAQLKTASAKTISVKSEKIQYKPAKINTVKLNKRKSFNTKHNTNKRIRARSHIRLR